MARVKITRSGGYDPSKGRSHPDNHDATLERAKRGAWTAEQREAVRAWLEIVQPHNSSLLVTNVEDAMPSAFRRGFEALFDKLGGSRG